MQLKRPRIDARRYPKGRFDTAMIGTEIKEDPYTRGPAPYRCVETLVAELGESIVALVSPLAMHPVLLTDTANVLVYAVLILNG